MLFRSNQSLFSTAGSALMIQFIAGVKTKDSEVSNTFTRIISGALTAIKNKYNDFYNAGRYLVEGFAYGITANTYLAEARARAMAAAAAQAAARELDEHSPSRVGYRIGAFFGLGFVNALIDYTSKSYQAGSEIAKSAKSGLSNAISKITDILENDIDTQPSIRPVLDLTDIKNNANQIDGLFGQRSVSLATTVGSQIRNGVSVLDSIGDVIKTSIESVQDKIDEPGNSTYVLEVPVYLEGREIAKASAPYTQKELDRINKFQTRMGGVL